MRSDTALRHRIDAASVGRSSACSSCSSSRSPDWDWRTRGPAPNTSSARTRTRSRSSKGSRTASRACPLSRVYEVQQLAVSELPPFYQEQVKANIDVPSLDSARATVAELTEAAKTCASRTADDFAAPRADTRFETRAHTRPAAMPSPTPSATVNGSTDPTADHASRRTCHCCPRKRRGVELALIIFALGLALGAYALVDLNVTGELSPTFPYVVGVCMLLATLAHIAVRWRLPYADPVILPCVILLNGLGLVMIHRIDLINDPPLNGARQQLIWTALGVLMFILVVTWLNDHRPLQRFTYTIGLAGIVLLLLPLVPVSAQRSSAPRSGSRSVPTVSNRLRPPRSCSPSPSPPTWSRSGMCSR